MSSAILKTTLWGDVFSNWDNAAKIAAPEVEYDISVDPLAYILERRDTSDFKSNRKYTNKVLYEELNNPSHVKTVTDLKYTAEAKNIRDHYKKKIFMVTMKKHDVSSFREIVDEIIIDPGKIKQSQIPVMLRLPDYYQEDLDMTHLMDNYVSAEPGSGLLDQTVEYGGGFGFVKKIFRYGRRAERIRHYFKTDSNSLICITIDPTNPHYSFMNYFADENKTFNFRGKLHAVTEKGYQGFKFYYPLGNDYEIY